MVEPDSLAAPGVDRGGVDASRSDLVAIEHRDGGERPVAAETVAAGYAAPGIHASPAGNRRLNPHHGDPALSGRPDHVRWLSGRVGSRCRRMSRPATGSPACRLRRGRRSSRAVKGRREGVTRRSGRLGRGGAGDRDGDQARCWPPAVSARPRAGRSRPRAGPGTVAPASAWTETPGVPSAFIQVSVWVPDPGKDLRGQSAAGSEG